MRRGHDRSYFRAQSTLAVTCRDGFSDFQDRRIQPLCHLSIRLCGASPLNWCHLGAISWFHIAKGHSFWRAARVRPNGCGYAGCNLRSHRATLSFPLGRSLRHRLIKNRLEVARTIRTLGRNLNLDDRSRSATTSGSCRSFHENGHRTRRGQKEACTCTARWCLRTACKP